MVLEITGIIGFLLLCGIFAVTLAIDTTAAADPVTVTLKSGGTMTGNLVGKTTTEIKIETAYGVIPLQADKLDYARGYRAGYDAVYWQLRYKGKPPTHSRNGL